MAILLLLQQFSETFVRQSINLKNIFILSFLNRMMLKNTQSMANIWSEKTPSRNKTDFYEDRMQK